MEILDGRLYITNGNSTDDGVSGGQPEEPLSGTLLSVPVDARGIVIGVNDDTADLVVEATVMRNTYDVAFRPGTAEAWMAMYKQNENPVVSAACDGSQKLPEQLMGLHTSANGLAFGPEDGGWDGDLFVALFGNFFGDEIVGHRIVRVPIGADGASSPPEDFLFLPAPLDLTFVGDTMYVADFAAGVLVVPSSG